MKELDIQKKISMKTITLTMNKIKITGEWDGQPIWREKTPEEKLEEVGIDSSQAMTHLALLANKDNKNYDNSNSKSK